VQLDDWLKKLEIAGALKVRPSDFVLAASFPKVHLPYRDYEAALTDADVLRINAGALLGASALGANRAYLAEERLQNRARLDRPANDIAVLLVEDDRDQAELASHQLGLAGCQVRVAESQWAFLATLRDRGVPDAMFLDVELPDGNGFDLLTYARRHHRLALVPVIMLTAGGEPKHIRKGLALGADGYLPKPYSKSTLSDTPLRVLKHS